jgi:hypothetical protein
MVELVLTLVVVPVLVIGVVLAMATRRERRASLAYLTEAVRHLYLIAGQAWNAALQANTRIANLEERVRHLERSAHDHRRDVER